MQVGFSDKTRSLRTMIPSAQRNHMQVVIYTVVAWMNHRDGGTTCKWSSTLWWPGWTTGMGDASGHLHCGGLDEPRGWGNHMQVVIYTVDAWMNHRDGGTTCKWSSHCGGLDEPRGNHMQVVIYTVVAWMNHGMGEPRASGHLHCGGLDEPRGWGNHMQVVIYTVAAWMNHGDGGTTCKWSSTLWTPGWTTGMGEPHASGHLHCGGLDEPRGWGNHMQVVIYTVVAWMNHGDGRTTCKWSSTLWRPGWTTGMGEPHASGHLHCGGLDEPRGWGNHVQVVIYTVDAWMNHRDGGTTCKWSSTLWWPGWTTGMGEPHASGHLHCGGLDEPRGWENHVQVVIYTVDAWMNHGDGGTTCKWSSTLWWPGWTTGMGEPHASGHLHCGGLDEPRGWENHMQVVIYTVEAWMNHGDGGTTCKWSSTLWWPGWTTGMGEPRASGHLHCGRLDEPRGWGNHMQVVIYTVDAWMNHRDGGTTCKWSSTLWWPGWTTGMGEPHASGHLHCGGLDEPRGWENHVQVVIYTVEAWMNHGDGGTTCKWSSTLWWPGWTTGMGEPRASGHLHCGRLDEPRGWGNHMQVVIYTVVAWMNHGDGGTTCKWSSTLWWPGWTTGMGKPHACGHLHCGGLDEPRDGRNTYFV